MIAAAVATAGAQAQPPASAGARRPNLRVLQALPEAQLFPMMNVLADSLGVTCEYCHVQLTPDFSKTPSNVGGWAWDRDDKPQKGIAREMMRMVIALNDGSFKGETRITCYTCHRGTPRPARTPPLPPAGAATAARPPSSLPSADRVWANYVGAVGRVDQDAPGTGTIISGWDDQPEGRYARVEIVLSGTDRYRITITAPNGTISQGMAGTVAWTAANDRVQTLSTENLARMQRVAMRYRPVKERPAGLQVVGVERVGDHDLYVATAASDAGATSTLYFDAVTGLLRRQVTTTDTMLLPLQEQVEYDDYRDVGGVYMPFRIRISDGAPYSTLTRTFLQIRRHVRLDEAMFKPPSGAR